MDTEAKLFKRMFLIRYGSIGSALSSSKVRIWLMSVDHRFPTTGLSAHSGPTRTLLLVIRLLSQNRMTGGFNGRSFHLFKWMKAQKSDTFKPQDESLSKPGDLTQKRKLTGNASAYIKA